MSLVLFLHVAGFSFIVEIYHTQYNTSTRDNRGQVHQREIHSRSKYTESRQKYPTQSQKACLLKSISTTMHRQNQGFTLVWCDFVFPCLLSTRRLTRNNQELWPSYKYFLSFEMRVSMSSQQNHIKCTTPPHPWKKTTHNVNVGHWYNYSDIFVSTQFIL